MKAIAILLLALVVIGGFSAKTALFAFTPVKFAPEHTIVEIQKRQGPKEITHTLVAEHAIPEDAASDFVFLGRLGRFWKHIKVGEYEISPQMSPLDIFRVLNSGVSVLHSLTVREGENMYEIADALAEMKLANKEAFLKDCTDPKFIASLGFKAPLPKTLEGYLFPDTYFLSKTMSTEDIVRDMYRRFSAVWGPEQETRAAQLGMTRHQVVTLASMIEKETGATQERPMISSVFYNRLKKKMRLQSDPTTIYGIWDRYDGNLHKSDLSTENDYNTYYVPALPVGPIANPGREAIQAALFPVESQYLYFVSHNDGTHEFTTNYGDHVSAVKKFQLDPKAREGKSWRDLQKKKPATGDTKAG